MSPQLSSKRSAVVRVTSNVPKSEETTLELEGAIVERLRQARTFERVYSKLSSQANLADVEIKVTIVEFSGVSDVARALGGAFAGQALIVADVELRETGGGALGEARVEGRSSAGTAFAGTTMQAVQKTAEQVAAFARGK